MNQWSLCVLVRVAILPVFPTQEPRSLPNVCPDMLKRSKVKFGQTVLQSDHSELLPEATESSRSSPFPLLLIFHSFALSFSVHIVLTDLVGFLSPSSLTPSLDVRLQTRHYMA